jgi:hypothetical protein
MKACRAVCQELLAIIAFVASQNCSGQAPPAIDWNALPDEKISLRVTAQPPGGKPETIEAKVLFSRQHAVSLAYDPEARYNDNWKHPIIFDLAQMAWFHDSAKEWVPLAKCREWEQATLEKSRASLARERDPEIRAFADAMINPQLQLRKRADGGLELSNSHLSYVIVPTPGVTPDQIERFIRYDQVNAYQKAMTNPRTPPTVQIAVDNAMYQQRVFPKELTTTIKTGRGEVKFKSDARLEAFSPSDASEVRSALAILNP